MSKPLILVAEDDESVRLSLSETLERHGYEVIAVADGAQALQQIREGRRRPSLVLLDLSMPVMSGWEFLEIRKRDPVLLLIPVIVVSAESKLPPGIPSELFLRKPLGYSTLQKSIENVLAWSSPEPERVPHRSEPWSVGSEDGWVVRNSFGQAVAYADSERSARRIVAAINGASRLSTEALEQGIIDKGLNCLYELNEYDAEEEYRNRIGGASGFERIVERRRQIAEQLAASHVRPTADERN